PICPPCNLGCGYQLVVHRCTDAGALDISNSGCQCLRKRGCLSRKVQEDDPVAAAEKRIAAAGLVQSVFYLWGQFPDSRQDQGKIMFLSWHELLPLSMGALIYPLANLFGMAIGVMRC